MAGYSATSATVVALIPSRGRADLPKARAWASTGPNHVSVRVYVYPCATKSPTRRVRTP
jgi:hypothetical protein